MDSNKYAIELVKYLLVHVVNNNNYHFYVENF